MCMWSYVCVCVCECIYVCICVCLCMLMMDGGPCIQLFCPNSAQLLLIWADNSAQNQHSVLPGTTLIRVGNLVKVWSISSCLLNLCRVSYEWSLRVHRDHFINTKKNEHQHPEPYRQYELLIMFSAICTLRSVAEGDTSFKMFSRKKNFRSVVIWLGRGSL